MVEKIKEIYSKSVISKIVRIFSKYYVITALLIFTIQQLIFIFPYFNKNELSKEEQSCIWVLVVAYFFIVLAYKGNHKNKPYIRYFLNFIAFSYVSIYIFAFIVFIYVYYKDFALLALIPILLLYIFKFYYFGSKKFLSEKEKTLNFLNEYNEINNYLNSLSEITIFFADTKDYEYEDLADYENTSKAKIRRDKYKSNLHCKYTYNTSLNIVKNASQKPIEYLCRYFNIKPTKQNLEKLEQIGQNIDRMQNTLSNLEKRRKTLIKEFQAPLIIKIFFRKEFLKKLDIKIPKIKIQYPTYIFEYVSPSGNSSQKTSIYFDNKTIEATAKYIADKIRYNTDAKNQRSLMTQKLRNFIKQRDKFACQICKASLKDHALLLLEVDHIIPISKGGLSTKENLQTLCWKCNRTKSNKIYA